MKLVTDLGTENSLAAALHAYFWEDVDAHSYVPSPRNQRIESWWSFYVKTSGAWWRNFFRQLETDGTIDMTSDLNMECLWYCFSGVIQKDLDVVKKQWNTHRIRKSRFDTVSGRPNILYFLPSRSEGEENLKLLVPRQELHRMTQYISIIKKETDYQVYFKYAQRILQISDPENYHEALVLYNRLIVVAVHGS